MADMNIKRIGGEYAAPVQAARRAGGSAGVDFAQLLRSAAEPGKPAGTGPSTGPADRRQQLAHETARRWQENLSAWRLESSGMDAAAGIRYCNEKAAAWLTGLRESEPAIFREWLAQEQWQLRESGLDNAILPEGFTGEDMARWLAKDVLEYL